MIGRTVLSAADQQRYTKVAEPGRNGSADVSPRLDRIERHLSQHERAIQALLTSAVAILKSIHSTDEESPPANGDQRGPDS